MRRKNETLPQKERRRLSIFLRPDQWKELNTIKESEEVLYMQDVIEEVIDLGLRVYYGNQRESEKEDREQGDNYLYD